MYNKKIMNDELREVINGEKIFEMYKINKIIEFRMNIERF